MTVKLQKGSKFKNGDKSPEIEELQQTLYDEGYLQSEYDIDSTWGPKTRAANEAYERDKQFGVGRQILRGLGNFVRNPAQAAIDMILWGADRAGAPSNVTNYLRDLNVAIPYRAKAKLTALIRSVGDMDFSEAYEDALRHPSRYMDLTTIRPMPNTNGNYSDEEVEVIGELLDGKDYIDSYDQRRVTGKYGSGSVPIWDYVTKPEYIVQTSMGQAGHSGRPDVAYDIWDTNVSTKEGKDDNDKYMELALKNIQNGKGLKRFLNYPMMRTSLTLFGTHDIFPDEYKIHTQIDTKDENNN